MPWHQISIKYQMYTYIQTFQLCRYHSLLGSDPPSGWHSNNLKYTQNMTTEHCILCNTPLGNRQHSGALQNLIIHQVEVYVHQHACQVDNLYDDRSPDWSAPPFERMVSPVLHDFWPHPPRIKLQILCFYLSFYISCYCLYLFLLSFY